MRSSRLAAPPGGWALLAALAVAGCALEQGPAFEPDELEAGEAEAEDFASADDAEPDAEPDASADDAGPASTDEADREELDSHAAHGCPLGAPGVYTPYALSGAYPSGPVDDLQWAGASSTYPAGVEDFRGYGQLPGGVECSNDKKRRSYLDVTCGCLDAVAVGSYTRGLIRANDDNYFRALALGHVPGNARPIKWTDQGVEYRFFHRTRSGDAGAGFKAFARYRSENDLYVASWRFDGVVQIQQKLCGEYTALAVNKHFGPPSLNAWHWIRFEAVGDQLRLYLDDDLVLSATSSSLSWGTAGIRIDSADGAYIDDWAVYAP
jgi:hypothetical protein